MQGQMFSLLYSSNDSQVSSYKKESVRQNTLLMTGI